MGAGFKTGGSGYFKATLNITANPNAVVVIELDTSRQEKTADANGNVSFIIKRKGTYHVTSDFGADTTIDIVGYQIYTVDITFSATVVVQTNPGATITLTNYDDTEIYFRGNANTVTGVATVTVAKSGSYTISTSNKAGFDAENNTNSVTVSTSGSTQSVQFIKMNIPGALNVGNYSTNALTAYWERPKSDWTGVNLRRSPTSSPSSRSQGNGMYSGAGNADIVLNSTSTVNGYTDSGLTTNSRYYYSIFSYLTINGVEYWASTYRSSNGTAASYTGTEVTIKLAGTWEAPTGWRTINIFGVGGGGGGAGGHNTARGGGGGGYTATSGNISIVPGKKYSIEIGLGGAGGLKDGTANTSSTHGGKAGGATKFVEDGVSKFSVSGGYGGWYNLGSNGSSGQSGGSGGSGGGAQGYYKEGSSLNSAGAKGGEYGGAGGDRQSYPDGRKYTGGPGQGSTTRAWGLESGTPYAGGGGGGGRHNSGGSGGAGGGGAGGSSGSGGNGTANTGGGGGGGGDNNAGGAGGTGIMLIKCVG